MFCGFGWCRVLFSSILFNWFLKVIRCCVLCSGWCRLWIVRLWIVVSRFLLCRLMMVFCVFMNLVGIGMLFDFCFFCMDYILL